MKNEITITKAVKDLQIYNINYIMTQKQRLEAKIESIARKEFGVPQDSNSFVTIPYIKSQVNKIPLVTIIMAVLKFLIFIRENLFNEKGKFSFRLVLIKIIPLAKAIETLVNDIINSI